MKASSKTCKKSEKSEKCQVSAHLNRTQVARIEKMAKASHRSLSGQIAFLLEQGLTNLSDEELKQSGISFS